jgi:putative zinc finger/helix-turn-helix YgiT family protein
MRTRRENFRYDASGLPGVTLLGVEVRRCPKCGEYEVSIPNIEGLHRAIAFAVIRKRTRLTPAEIRYLRTSLGWSGADFARHMGVAAETVSRWETGATPMGAAADRLLRLMVVARAPVSDYSLDELAAIDETKAPTTTRLGLRSGEAGWHAEAA